jgi:hypothetical protein
VVILLVGPPGRATPFLLPCPLPYDSIKQTHPIDGQCDSTGTFSSPKQARQNGAKNNFCAAGKPAQVTQLSFRKLQEQAAALKVPFGSQGAIPPKRSVLHAIYKTSLGDMIGEGSLVRYVGFVLHARYSNVDKGESCNCERPGAEWNDIHINLGPTRGTSLCQSIVAEMSPHFRPALWDTTTLALLEGRPMRVTGQLFFDSVHKPCAPNKPASPPRISLWEIHPVYACDVCKHSTLASCPIDDDSVWEPIDHQTVVAATNH